MDRVLEMGKVHRFQGLTGREDFDASMVRRLLMGRDTTREDDDETQEVNNGVRRYTVDDDGPGKYRERDLFAMQDTSITCMQIDPQENKFLLTGNTAGVVHLYDMDASDGNTNALHNRFGAASTPSLRRRARYLNATGANPTCEALQSFGPRTSNTGIQGHTASIGALTWYTVDNGLFLTGGSDRRVLSWDTNAFEPAYEFQALGPVQDLAMSTCAALHATHNYCLAAVATSTDSRISLIDIKSCASTHTLVGHTTGGVRRLVWSPDDPYKLVSGGSDGSIRIWDVRKGGKSACVDVLDMNTVEERGEFDADTDSPPAESWCDSPREKRKKQFSQEYYKHKLEKALEDCETSTSSMNAKTKIRKISKPPSDVAFQPQDFSHGRVKESDQRRTRDTNKAHGGPITGMTFPSCRRVIARTSRRKHDLKLDDSSHCEKAVLVSTGTDNELRLWDFSYNDGPRRKVSRSLHFLYRVILV